MERELKKLRSLFDMKVANKNADIGSTQIALLQKLLNDEAALKQAHETLLSQAASLEQSKEFFLSQNEINDVIRHRDTERKAASLFGEQIVSIEQDISTLIRNLQKQESQGLSKVLLQEEQQLIESIQKRSAVLRATDEQIKEYLKDMNKLTYKKKWVRGAAWVCKHIKGVFADIRVEGLENIPKKGPCILAPHHYHAAFDPMLLMAVVPRPVYFLTSVETFISWGAFDTVLYRLGALPFKRNEQNFPERRDDAVPYGKVENFPSSNFETLRKSLLHLEHADALVVFPEGEAQVIPTYHNPSPFSAPQLGFVQLAAIAEKTDDIRVPIIPIGIYHEKKAVRYKVTIRIGEPVFIRKGVADLSQPARQQALQSEAERIFDMVKALSNPM